jgi:formyl-CoA transferase
MLPSSSGPLTGVRVLEFSQVIAAPFCGTILSDMGATVTKVEPINGESWRQTGQIVPNETRGFVCLNRGKQDIAIDLAHPEARSVIGRLVQETDVVTINYRPGVPERLGIDYESLRQINPRLIYCENTGYGLRGPLAREGGYDVVAQALAGLMAGEGKLVDGVPGYLYPGIADYMSGMHMVSGICAALYSRDRTGVGQRITTSLIATALAVQTLQFTRIESMDAAILPELLEALKTARAERKTFAEQLKVHDSYRFRYTHDAYYRIHQTADGFITVGALAADLKRRVRDLLGVHDPRFAPSGAYDALPEGWAESEPVLMREVERLFLEKTTAEWQAILTAAGVPNGPLYFVEELVDHPQFTANGLVVELEHELLGTLHMAGPPFEMSGTPLVARAASPLLGADNEAMLASVGYSEEEIAAFRERRVIR